MSIQSDWLKFVINGRVDDYLKYVNSCKKDAINGGAHNANFDRCFGYKGNEYRREGQAYNPDDT